MDPDVEKIPLNLGEKSSHVFLDFMARTAKFDELVGVGRGFLIGFYQGLEILRRPQLHKASDVVKAIIETNDTDRMKAYVGAGYKLPHLDIQNICKLHTCKQGLVDHLRKGKVLLDELESLKEDAIGITMKVNKTTSDLLNNSIEASTEHQEHSFEEEEVESVDLQDKSILHTSMMAAIHGMLKLDYDMQKNIIESLKIGTSLSELETYCLMWDLRPFIDEDVMRQGLEEGEGSYYVCKCMWRSHGH